MTSALSAILTPDAVGLLDRHVTVAIAEISRSGCLLESSSVIAPGTVGTLNVEIDRTTYSDHVRVARCSAVRGGGERHHVGVEFLALERPGPESLRRYAASLGADTVRFSGPMPLRFRTR